MNISKLRHLPKIDTRKLRAPKEAKKAAPCYKEMTAFMMCIKGDPVHDFNSCKGLELALSECMRVTDAHRLKAKNAEHKSTITYHLQKFARELGYKL